MKPYSEDALIEQPAISLFGTLGWQTINAYSETFGEGGTLGRANRGEVMLRPRLLAALARLNPDLPRTTLELAADELARDRSLMSTVAANREVYALLKDGVKVKTRDEDDGETDQTVRVIDWRTPASNDFLLASQLWITGELHTRRTDLVGFVNGLPLLLVELKAAHKRLEDAYNDNLSDYKDTIPQLFWYNALILLSNGRQSRVGSLTAAWEHFSEWKRVATESERGVIALETTLRGTCTPSHLLDLTENFTVFADIAGGTVKLVAMNHQYLGVNNAIARLRETRGQDGKLGVFWHTQGSGKSYSMVFLAQKVLRTVPGNWTFLLVTDRQELDDQLYQTFARTGILTEAEQTVHATSGAHLRVLLGENHRLLFTLIQKFHVPPGERFPTLSERDDIIVITDEAHRSQYARFALNMRAALPNAAFLGFTGTPLIAGEDEETRRVFGDYVSVYNFQQSVEDGATVPLYYENRIPELQLTNDDLNDDLAGVIEAAGLDEAQEARLEREFARQYQLITRDDRLETIAADIVEHFLGRGQGGKGMVVAIDKPTTVRMYDKVKRRWDQRLADLRAQRRRATGAERAALDRQIAYLAETDLAVVVSQEQGEIATFRQKGLDIAPHRKRMLTEDLETKFKDPDDPFRLVFVTAMWMTGFDVPNLTTLYLDRPLRNHTLMQTIARANRVFPGKTRGLIVDYVGVFRDLQRALAIYGTGPRDGSTGEGDLPVREKDELTTALQSAITAAETFLHQHDIDPDAIIAAAGFTRVQLLDDAVDLLVASDEIRDDFLALVRAVLVAYQAVLPDPRAANFDALRLLLAVLAEQIRALQPATSIDGVLGEIERVLDESIAAEGYVIRERPANYDASSPTAGLIDLSQIDFAVLRRQFEQGRKHTEAARLRGAVSAKLDRLLALNRTRSNYREQFQQLIAEYNDGSANVEEFFQQLLSFAQSLNAEEQRSVGEALSEEELALFDLLTKPEPALSKAEAAKVKQVARDLLNTLKHEKLVLDWRKRQQSRAAVLVTIEDTLDRGLPEIYDIATYQRKCAAVYQHIYDAYQGAGHSIYGSAASA